MNNPQNENLFLALGEVGGDLVELAERGTFRPNLWRRWGAVAACMALLIGLASWALPKFSGGAGILNGAASESAVIPEAPTEMVRFRYTYYYLDEELLEAPDDLSTMLGVVEAADDETMIDCPVYLRAGATEYTNHSVHGLTVFDQIYVQLPEGYVLATTYNEKSLSRYGYDDVVQAVESGDTAWVVESFAAPLIRYAPEVIFETPEMLNSEQLNLLFLASTQLNTGVDVSQQWLSADGSRYVVPTADVRWRLDRFLTEYEYWPSQTRDYVAGADALEFSADRLRQEQPLYLALTNSALLPDSSTVILTVTQYADENLAQPLQSYTYEIHFFVDSWHYERIGRNS